MTVFASCTECANILPVFTEEKALKNTFQKTTEIYLESRLQLFKEDLFFRQVFGIRRKSDKRKQMIPTPTPQKTVIFNTGKAQNPNDVSFMETESSTQMHLKKFTFQHEPKFYTVFLKHGIRINPF